MAELVMPAWIAPPVEQVAAVRAAAVAGIEAEAVDGVVGPVHDLGIWCAVQWVAGELEASPLSMTLDAPRPRRVVVERLLAFEVLTGRVCTEEYERYGYEPLAPSERFGTADYAGGVWHTLAWLLGEETSLPGLRYTYRPQAAG